MTPLNLFTHITSMAVMRAWLSQQPKKGRGVARRLAEHLRVSSVLVSQVLNGTRRLRLDHAFAVAQFMGLSVQETDYFLLLVQYEHASTHGYRAHLQRKLDLQRSAATEVHSRVARDIHMNEAVRARFYSHWHYSAIRLLTDIPTTQTPGAIARALDLNVSRVTEILDFLVEFKLCVQKSGRYLMAVKSTHLESDSTWAFSRQLHWRQKGMQRMEQNEPSALYYTGPMVLSLEDAAWVREKLVETIRVVTDRARESPSEGLSCLNIDWFTLFSARQEKAPGSGSRSQ